MAMKSMSFIVSGLHDTESYTNPTPSMRSILGGPGSVGVFGCAWVCLLGGYGRDWEGSAIVSCVWMLSR